MELGKYFEITRGTGILATADAAGKVDAALYGRPHVVDDQTVVFLMSDRLSHRNLLANPSAAYLFLEQGAGLKGLRLHLEKVREEAGESRIQELLRHYLPDGCDAEAARFLVTFRVQHVRPLVGEDVAATVAG